MNFSLHSSLRCAIVTSMLLLNLTLLLNACIGAEPAVSIEKKLFLIDPGSLNASFALKVTIAECPLSGFLAFDMHGLDADNFVLASFPMHVMELVEGKRSTCTKRQ